MIHRFLSADPGCPVDNWSPTAQNPNSLSILLNPPSLLFQLMLTAPPSPCVPQTCNSGVNSHSSPISEDLWNASAFLYSISWMYLLPFISAPGTDYCIHLCCFSDFLHCLSLCKLRRSYYNLRFPLLSTFLPRQHSPWCRLGLETTSKEIWNWF